jgi:hypothetical protein
MFYVDDRLEYQFDFLLGMVVSGKTLEDWRSMKAFMRTIISDICP